MYAGRFVVSVHGCLRRREGWIFASTVVPSCDAPWAPTSLHGSEARFFMDGCGQAIDNQDTETTDMKVRSYYAQKTRS